MSSKPSVPPGRRTPLSLSGVVTKTAPLNKGSNNISNGGGINSNGQPAPSNTKDNKLQQQKGDQPAVNNSESRENPNRKQQVQGERKQQGGEIKKSNEKSQNGASSSNKQETSENKQQLHSKEKLQHPNENEENKVNEKEKSEKSDKVEKPKDKLEKDITKSKEDKKREHNMAQNKKDEKKTKESKDSKDDKKEVASKSDAKTEMQQQQVKDDTKPKNDKEKDRSFTKKPEEKEEKMDIVEQITLKSNPNTPKSNSKTNRTSTPVSKTPTKITENAAQKPTPPSRVKSTTPAYKKVETTAVDDNEIEMEPLAMENSPVKSSQPEKVANIKIVPSATSTPGKLNFFKRRSEVPKTDVQLAMEVERSSERPRTFSQISGRKSIRPISDYTPSKFQSNLQFRESYRLINTELDVTNTSMNVTVGSEVPSNFSFSLFGRGRKRDRASPPQHSQSAIGELVVELSPPKKARLDIHTILSAVSSPISLLRNRFSKASLQSSTPFKLQQNFNTDEDEIEVQNVSGVSVDEEITTPDKETAEMNSSADDNDATLGEEAREAKLTSNIALSLPIKLHSEGKEFSYDEEESNIKSTETSMQSVSGYEVAKNKKCVVM